MQSAYSTINNAFKTVLKNSNVKDKLVNGFTDLDIDSNTYEGKVF